MTEPDRNVTLLITRNGMGQADTDLAHKLVSSYLDLLDLEDRLPGRICFYAEGVRLACQGSPVVEILQDLEKRGVRLIVCTTCLRYYDIESTLAVGIKGNMQQIQVAQWEAAKVITI